MPKTKDEKEMEDLNNTEGTLSIDNNSDSSLDLKSILENAKNEVSEAKDSVYWLRDMETIKEKNILNKEQIEDIYSFLLSQNKELMARYFINTYLIKKPEDMELHEMIYKKLSESDMKVTGRIFQDDTKYYRVTSQENASDIFLIHLEEELGKDYANNIKLNYEARKIGIAVASEIKKEDEKPTLKPLPVNIKEKGSHR